MRKWVDIKVDKKQVVRERAVARELRKSNWWQAQIQSGICHYCGKQVGREQLTLDHVVPLARGGRSNKGNVVPACDACNKSKGVLTPAERILLALEDQEILPGRE